MKHDQKSEILTRDAIMKMLSDEEIAKVSTAETATALAEGDEYLDLKNIDKGVRRAVGRLAKMGDLLPRNAVHGDTWSKILVQLASRS